MAETKQRPKITVISPNDGDDQAVLHAGDITLDLRGVQAVIDKRPRDRLSWSHLMNAIDSHCVIDGARVPGALQKRLKEPLARRIRRPLSQLEQVKLNNQVYPSPVAGFAATISEYFDLPAHAPRFHKVLLATEREGLKYGKKQCDKRTLAESDAAEAQDSSPEDVGFIAQIREQDVEGHAAAVREQRQSLGPSFVASGGQLHHQAHRAAREIGGPQRNPYAELLGIVDSARAGKGWRTRTLDRSEQPPTHDR